MEEIFKNPENKNVRVDYPDGTHHIFEPGKWSILKEGIYKNLYKKGRCKVAYDKDDRHTQTV